MATAIAWVIVQGGEWTRLFQGPSFHVSGVQLLEFTASSPEQAEYTVSFTVHRYSAAAPFYYSISGSRSAIRQGDYLPGSSTSNIYYLPAVSISPWTEIWIMSDRSCRAHILV
jgi:hypothetical protein